jgi:hypothetical protein
MDSELFDRYEPAQYLNGFGFFAHLWRDADATSPPMRQQCHPTERLIPVLTAGIDPATDNYISQAIFRRPRRTIVDLRTLRSVFADLDFYKTAKYARRSPDFVAQALLITCGDIGKAPRACCPFQTGSARIDRLSGTLAWPPSHFGQSCHGAVASRDRSHHDQFHAGLFAALEPAVGRRGASHFYWNGQMLGGTPASNVFDADSARQNL